MILRDHMVLTVNAICALRQQLICLPEQSLDNGAKFAIETSIVKLCTRLDTIVDMVELWAPQPPSPTLNADIIPPPNQSASDTGIPGAQ